MKLSASQALRVAEEQQRVYVSHILAALLVADVTKLDSYKLVLGDIAARMEVAESLSKLARDLEAQESGAEGKERSEP